VKGAELVLIGELSGAAVDHDADQRGIGDEDAIRTDIAPERENRIGW